MSYNINKGIGNKCPRRFCKVLGIDMRPCFPEIACWWSKIILLGETSENRSLKRLPICSAPSGAFCNAYKLHFAITCQDSIYMYVHKMAFFRFTEVSLHSSPCCSCRGRTPTVDRYCDNRRHRSWRTRRHRYSSGTRRSNPVQVQKVWYFLSRLA